MVLGIDHIAISAGRLQEGVEYVEAALGVPLEAGGRHLRFGTHNRLLNLGELYLEVIAIDPQAEAPFAPRWFDLDRFSGRPRPTNWICRILGDKIPTVFQACSRNCCFKRNDGFFFSGEGV